MERSHLLVQIVDARNPLGFRCQDLEEYVKELGGKKSLLLINKSDLLTSDQRSVLRMYRTAERLPEFRIAWADYFDSEGISYAFFSAAAASQKLPLDESDIAEDEEFIEDQDEDEDDDAEAMTEGPEQECADADMEDDEEGWSTEGEEPQAGPSTRTEQKLENGERLPLSEVAQDVANLSDARINVLSVSELENLFESAAPQVASDEKLVIGLVGYPNVGKSSTINALLGEKKTSVSATPGKTKHFQTLLLTDRITLCDCPGLVFPQFANTQADMIVDGVLPIDQMKEYSAPAELVCRRVPRDILEGTYGIRIDVKDEEDGGTGEVGWEEFLSAYASKCNMPGVFWPVC